MDRLHSLSHEQAITDLMTCCSTRTWAELMSELRPFADETDLVETGTRLASQLDWPEVLQALAAHPRIGERASGQDREGRWSQEEQAGVAENFRKNLIAGNIAYERRFGHVFLICATGLSGEEMHAELTRRLTNDISAERREIRRELSKIVGLRLRKLVAR